MPSSPKGWVRYAYRVLEAAAVPRGVKFDGTPGGDRRMADSRETALSVKIMLENSANGCGRRGPKLLAEMYLATVPVDWGAYSEKKKRLIRKTERCFRSSLVAAGFLPPPSPR